MDAMGPIVPEQEYVRNTIGGQIIGTLYTLITPMLPVVVPRLVPWDFT